MIAGVVLAAGRSARLGQPKQLLPYRGRPLLAWALDAMAASKADQTVVVLGHEAERIEREVDLRGARVVYNARYAEGLSASLQAALAALGEDITAAVLTVGDQPLLDAAIIDALVDAHRGANAPLVATDYGDYRGAPMLLSRSLWPLAHQIHGDQGARALLRAYSDEVATVAAPPTIAVDVDTWEDYDKLQAGQEQPGGNGR